MLSWLTRRHGHNEVLSSKEVVFDYKAVEDKHRLVAKL